MRMAAVFTLTTVTIARRTQIVSRWLTMAGFVSALVLLIGVGFSPWVDLAVPGVDPGPEHRYPRRRPRRPAGAATSAHQA